MLESVIHSILLALHNLALVGCVARAAVALARAWREVSHPSRS